MGGSLGTPLFGDEHCLNSLFRQTGLFGNHFDGKTLGRKPPDDAITPLQGTFVRWLRA